MTTAAGASPWWADAVVYEVYVRSFGDGDGDGVGDLSGLTARLGHIADLGADAVWVTPFYPSPGRDHGYDVSDFTDVDPLFGDLDAFDRFVERAHGLGLRVLIDVVPNHTSDQHPWFVASRAAGRDANVGSVRDWYIWRDPAPDGGPPNNWISNFGGSAWTLDDASGQYYLHAYLPEQPDLNWRHDDVRQAWDDILRFWLERGVDGFRIDVAHNLLKHPDFPDNPERDVSGPAADGHPVRRVGRTRDAGALERVHDVDQDDILGVYRDLRFRLPRTRRGEPAFLLGETVVEDPERVARYVRPGVLDAAMWFGTDALRGGAADLVEALRAVEAASTDADAGVLAWFLSNHDRARPATRFGDADRALALASVVLAMPGPYLLYQGEELGVPDLAVGPMAAQDPIAVRAGDAAVARDRARGPMPWTAADDRGFGSADPWLPHGPLPRDGAVDRQTDAPGSVLTRWRSLLTTWRRIRAQVPRTVDIGRNGDVVTVRRGRLTIAVNLTVDAADANADAAAATVDAAGTAATGRPVWRSWAGRHDGAAGPRPGEATWWWQGDGRTL